MEELCESVLQASSKEQKSKWCFEIKRLIVENYKEAIPEKAKDLLLQKISEQHDTVRTRVPNGAGAGVSVGAGVSSGAGGVLGVVGVRRNGGHRGSFNDAHEADAPDGQNGSVGTDAHSNVVANGFATVRRRKPSHTPASILPGSYSFHILVDYTKGGQKS